jgi:tetratricopeptide (TPR) repeat protein
VGEGLAAQGKWDEAIGQYQRAVELQPGNAQGQESLGLALSQVGRFAEAVKHYERALAIDGGMMAARNNLAWALATCADASVRNGERAIELGERANQQAGGQDAAVLDTLAAAYAEAGRFGEAMRTGRAALALARAGGQVEAARGIAERLGLYEAGRPYHGGTGTVR